SREKVQEVTMDLSESMRKIVETCFPRATRVIDRFHVQKLALEAVQEIRIKHRWEAIDADNKSI
ncbi:MAG: transposase, partial [Prevotella sp.]|nr:transposase [Prevotella sp.]